MCERNTNWLSLTCPQLGTWPATQAYAPTQLNQGPFSLWDDAQPTEPHQSRLVAHFLRIQKEQVKLIFMTYLLCQYNKV